MPSGEEQQEEQEEEKDLARELAEEKAKEALKKAVVEPAKKAVKKAAVTAAKKVFLVVGKAVGAVLIKTFPIWGPIVLGILISVAILIILSGGGEEVCPELAQLKEQDPSAFQEIKKQYDEGGQDLEVICGWKPPAAQQKTAKDIAGEKSRLTPRPGTEADIKAGAGLPGLEAE
ncbi:MAG: hypothetical protein N2259_02930 [Patescibacteria group bacterium]|nr:hypothetical protein [Patescibacteria group bacterium]